VRPVQMVFKGKPGESWGRKATGPEQVGQFSSPIYCDDSGVVSTLYLTDGAVNRAITGILSITPDFVGAGKSHEYRRIFQTLGKGPPH